MIAAAVANDGVLMKPYLVGELQAPDLTVLDRTEPEELSTAMSPEVADQLSEMMRSVVASGTGTAAQIPGVDVAGKTGTAENAPEKAPHAWFIGFAGPATGRSRSRWSSRTAATRAARPPAARRAAPVARPVMQAVLGVGGG